MGIRLSFQTYGYKPQRVWTTKGPDTVQTLTQHKGYRTQMGRTTKIQTTNFSCGWVGGGWVARVLTLSRHCPDTV